MSTLLQLLTNYYKAVLESERIYNECAHKDLPVNQVADIEKAETKKEKETVNKMKEPENNEPAPKIVNETLLLQRQLTSLTSQLQDVRHKNEALIEQQKTFRALSETKITKYKQKIDEMKDKLEKNRETTANNENEADGYHTDDNKTTQRNSEASKKFDYHLLSPVANRGLKRGLRVTNGASSGNGTIFDTQPGAFSDNDSDEDVAFDGSRSPTHTVLGKPHMEHEESFIEALNNDPTANGKSKTKGKKTTSPTKNDNVKRRQLDGVDIPSLNDFSRDEDDSDTAGDPGNATTQFSQIAKRQPQKKRKLAKKKITHMSEDSIVVESP